MLALYNLNLNDFQSAALRAQTDQAPLSLSPRSKWRENSTRVIRFLTLRSFRGQGWQDYKNRKLRANFVSAIKNHSQNIDAKTTKKLLASTKPLTRFDVINTLRKVDPDQVEQTTLAMMRRGYSNPTYQTLEKKPS